MAFEKFDKSGPPGSPDKPTARLTEQSEFILNRPALRLLAEYLELTMTVDAQNYVALYYDPSTGDVGFEPCPPETQGRVKMQRAGGGWTIMVTAQAFVRANELTPGEVYDVTINHEIPRIRLRLRPAPPKIDPVDAIISGDDDDDILNTTTGEVVDYLNPVVNARGL